MNISYSSEVGKIKKILIKHPQDAFRCQKAIEAEWQSLNYASEPDYEKAVEEYEGFTNLLTSEIEEIHFLPKDDRTGLDSIYLRDCMVTTPEGAILGNMGKRARQGEVSAVNDYLTNLGFPIFGQISGEGILEGGDLIWLDAETVVVGQGYRTNAEGIRQFKALTSAFISEVITVPLPHWNGPDDVFHLMSIISPIDYNLALVYSRLLPIFFRERLIDRGVMLIEVPDSEFESMGCNVLAIAPRKCIMLSGNPITRKRLEAEGVEVLEYRGCEISLKGAGGPTCLTRPLIRAD